MIVKTQSCVLSLDFKNQFPLCINGTFPKHLMMNLMRIRNTLPQVKVITPQNFSYLLRKAYRLQKICVELCLMLHDIYPQIPNPAVLNNNS